MRDRRESRLSDHRCANPQPIDSLTIVPLLPLDQRSTYVVGLLDGIKTAGGASFRPSFTWSLVREPEPVVTVVGGDVISDRTPLDPNDPEQLQQLRGIDLLWRLHHADTQFLAAKGHANDKVLLAWEFSTQTTTAPLDPTVPGSPASAINPALPLAAVASIVPVGATAEQFLRGVLPAGSCLGDGAGRLPCSAVGDVVTAGLTAKSYQIDRPNPVPGDCTDESPQGCPIPGPWSDPVSPQVVKTEAQNVIGVLAMVPVGSVPETGWRTVIFGHGLGSTKNSVFVIGSQLNALGIAVLAIDFVAHDSRAIRISTDPARRCGDEGTARRDKGPPPTREPQCYAPFLSADLAGTRDNIRQTVLDLQSLVSAIKACGTTQCGQLKLDAGHLGYMGISLGGIVGSIAVASDPSFEGAVLNVPGVGLIDILERTESRAIRCSLVDALIDAGIVTGTKFNPGPDDKSPDDDTGTCTGDEWKTQPGYRQFSVIGRWALDPADGANFTRKLAARRFLIQEVVGDQVVPNFATTNEGMLVGLQPATANFFSGVEGASTVIEDNPQSKKWVRYNTVTEPAPGNAFVHASLLDPGPPGATNRVLGTGRLQRDALTYINNSLMDQ